MVEQAAVTVVCDVLPGREEALARSLAQMGGNPSGNRLIPFGRLPRTHFARLFAVGPPTRLVYMSDVDGTAEEHLATMVEVAGTGLDAVFGCCAGYPEAGGGDRRLAFLLDRRLRPVAPYVNTVGRGLDQVLEERALRTALEDFLDRTARDLPPDPLELREAIRAYVADQPDLAWALEPVRAFGLGWRLRRWLPVVLLAVAVVVLLPVLALAGPVYLLLLHRHEVRDVPSADQPDPARLAQLAALRDHLVQNPFSADAPVKAGWLRAFTLRLTLGALAFLARHLYNRGQVTGLRTIHFFRFVLMEGRLLFASSFDGSLESYMDDFIDQLGRGLNAIFGNAVGYPRTSFLFFGGAFREREFKDYVQVHEVPVPVFYSAYPDLTAVNVESNAALRAGLSGKATAEEARAWLRRL
jgi:hypothetical protein